MHAPQHDRVRTSLWLQHGSLRNQSTGASRCDVHRAEKWATLIHMPRLAIECGYPTVHLEHAYTWRNVKGD